MNPGTPCATQLKTDLSARAPVWLRQIPDEHRGGDPLIASVAGNRGRSGHDARNKIGFNANASVFATLICEAVGPFTQHSTNGAGVPLAPNGDFRIDDALVSAPPANCDSPVLLIRNSQPNPAWFAAGIPKQD